ncbi:hypothetical protein [Thermogemmatispora tikiterensis]|nr:hypothetical protein [Thermogemmatispora tikiterensis]
MQALSSFSSVLDARGSEQAGDADGLTRPDGCRDGGVIAAFLA